MAKMEKGLVEVTNNETGEKVSYYATTTPNRTTIGNTFFGDMNHRGIAKIQQKWPQVTDSKKYLQLLNALFKAHGVVLDESDLGNRAGSWNTTEAREQYTVTINGEVYNPPLGKSAQKKVVEAPVVEEIAIEPEAVEEPLVMEEPLVVPQPAVADTSSPNKDEKNLKTLLGAIKKGISKDKLMNLLTQQRGEQYAKQLWNKAQVIIKPKEQPITFEL